MHEIRFAAASIWRRARFRSGALAPRWFCRMRTFAQAAQTVAQNTPRTLEAVAEWQSVQLPQTTRVEFARRAAVRYGDRPLDDVQRDQGTLGSRR